MCGDLTQKRQQHWRQVRAFLQKNFGDDNWAFTLPSGSGNETYVAHGAGQPYFIKLGGHVEKYQVLMVAGLTPPLLATGILEDGTTILVQEFVVGRKPTRQDYQANLEQVAMIINKTHHNPQLKEILPAVSSNEYRESALRALTALRQRWATYKPQATDVADFVDECLGVLTNQSEQFVGAGLVASHNDICNANWLLTPESRFYLIDLESMALEDPACDVGALLWWYYPPRLRPRFLEIAGYDHDPQFALRMRVRMAIHALSITLPRAKSFDQFDPNGYTKALTDFRAVMLGEENPQGYD